MNKMDNIYTSGEYLRNNPSWHVEESEWKAKKISKMINSNKLFFNSVCEVGCGGGEILVQLKKMINHNCKFVGYEISPNAYKICKEKEGKNLNFKLKDFLKEKKIFFDVILVIDVIEHVENYFNFLKNIKSKGKYKIFHIPLDLSVQYVFRSKPILNARKNVGHIHYFTKEIALQILIDQGYEIIDYFYTAGGVEIPSKTLKNYFARFPRKLFFPINKDLCARIFGGYSLLVLTK